MAPTVEVIEATKALEPVLGRLLQLYIHDFSEFIDADVDADGLFAYSRFDLYWTEAGRHPFLFRVGGRWAGFALVRAGAPHDMAEFFVMRKYRRGGVGQAAAREVFARFPGPWQVRQEPTNPAATRFWHTAIPVAFEEDTTESGPVQRFSMP